MSDPHLLSYLAGVVDAHAAIVMKRTRNGSSVPYLTLSGTMFGALHMLPQSLGGDVVQHRRVRLYRLTGHRAVRAIRLLRPYLRVTGAVADQALQWGGTTAAAPRVRIVSKVPCAKGCGGRMAPESQMCWQCYAASQTKPAKSTVKTTARGDGYVEQTAPGRIVHRLMG